MAVVSALVPLFLANPQLYKKGIAPTAVSAKERPASMLYVFKNDSLDPHLPALQLKFPGIGHTLRGAILSEIQQNEQLQCPRTVAQERDGATPPQIQQNEHRFLHTRFRSLG